MSQPTDTLKDDLAFMSAMARDGSKPTYAGGEFLLMAGLIFGLTSFAVSASLAGWLPVDMSLLWAGAMLAFFVTLPVLIIRSRRTAAAKMLGNRAVGEAWTAIGWAIFTLAAASAVIGWQTKNAAHLMMFAPIILALYGVGWSVSATLSGRTFNKVLTVASFVASVGVAALVKSPALMFAGYGLALICLAAIPGVIWIRLHRQLQG